MRPARRVARTKGTCRECGKPAVPGSSRCEEHRARNLAAQDRYKRRCASCSLGKPSDGEERVLSALREFGPATAAAIGMRLWAKGQHQRNRFAGAATALLHRLSDRGLAEEVRGTWHLKSATPPRQTAAPRLRQDRHARGPAQRPKREEAFRPPSNTDELIAGVAKYPGLTADELQKRLDMHIKAFRHALRYASSMCRIERVGWGSDSRYFPLGYRHSAVAPTDSGLHMVPGSGERHDDCVNYSTCLGRAAQEFSGQVCCPESCPGLRIIGREVHLLQLAASRPGSNMAAA